MECTVVLWPVHSSSRISTLHHHPAIILVRTISWTEPRCSRGRGQDGAGKGAVRPHRKQVMVCEDGDGGAATASAGRGREREALW